MYLPHALTCLYLLCCELCIIITVCMYEYTINKVPYNIVTAVGIRCCRGVDYILQSLPKHTYLCRALSF